MSLYTLSEFITLVKENIGIKDIPLPISDIDITNRFANSSLKEFSIRAPRIVTIFMGDADKIDPIQMDRNKRITYRIPRGKILDAQILAVTRFDVARPLGYSDYYVPQGMWASPDSVLSAIADIKMAAGVASAMGKAPTIRFIAPDNIEVYNGWSGGTYEADVAVTHDISLSTVSPTAFTHLLQLAELDISEFLYNKMKRLDNLDIGIGNIQLKIENWENAGREKRELLKEWDETANLDIDNISYF